jgi:hypothetical protein
VSVSTYRSAVVFIFVVFVAPEDADDDDGGGAYNPYGIGAANAARVVDVSATSAMNRREIDDDGASSTTTCPKSSSASPFSRPAARARASHRTDIDRPRPCAPRTAHRARDAPQLVVARRMIKDFQSGTL